MNKVYTWIGFSPNGKQVQAAMYAGSKAEVARAAGVSGPSRLHNLEEGGSDAAIAAARNRPGVLLYGDKLTGSTVYLSSFEIPDKRPAVTSNPTAEAFTAAQVKRGKAWETLALNTVAGTNERAEALCQYLLALNEETKAGEEYLRTISPSLLTR